MLISVGATGEHKDVTGTITIPEVAHDTTEDEYVVCSLCSIVCKADTNEFF
jgi:hypothetical protein